jgi:hypothetical protein
VIGTGGFEFETSRMCQRLEDIEFDLAMNCITIPTDLVTESELVKTFSKAYIIVEGVFKAPFQPKFNRLKNGREVLVEEYGIPLGRIKNISRFEVWPSFIRLQKLE